MFTTYRTLFIAVVLTGIVGAAGCQSSPFGTSNPFARRSPAPVVDMSTGAVIPPPVPEPGLALATDQRFKDVPLPVGVKEDLERSYVYESANLQIGRMVYTTREDVNSLAQFFIRECPSAQWQLEHVVQAGGADLEFRKPGKRLYVQIRNLGVTKGRLLIINLTPTEGRAAL
jgi:hypothetical protein